MIWKYLARELCNIKQIYKGSPGKPLGNATLLITRYTKVSLTAIAYAAKNKAKCIPEESIEESKFFGSFE